MSNQAPHPPEPQLPPSSDEPPIHVRAVLAREALRRRAVSAWIGFLLIAAGFVVVAVSYFLFPVFVVSCFYHCGAPVYSTAWELSKYGLSNFPDSPAVNALVLSSLPLLAVTTVVGCSICFLVAPHRMFAIWSYRALVAGFIALVILVTFLLYFGTEPQIGYVGMLLGYGLLWGGNRLFLTAHP